MRAFSLTTEEQSAFLDAVADGHRISDICGLFGVTTAGLRGLRKRDPDFAARYNEALEESADAAMEEIRALAIAPIEPGESDLASFKIAGDTHAARMRARESQFRILSWWIARRAPHKYGDKLDLRVEQTVSLSGALAAADARLLAARESLRMPHDVAKGVARILEREALDRLPLAERVHD